VAETEGRAAGRMVVEGGMVVDVTVVAATVGQAAARTVGAGMVVDALVVAATVGGAVEQMVAGGMVVAAAGPATEVAHAVVATATAAREPEIVVGRLAVVKAALGAEETETARWEVLEAAVAAGEAVQVAKPHSNERSSIRAYPYRTAMVSCTNPCGNSCRARHRSSGMGPVSNCSRSSSRRQR